MKVREFVIRQVLRARHPRAIVVVSLARILVAVAVPTDAPAQVLSWPGGPGDAPFCERMPSLCTDSVIPYDGHYIGHDEPAVLFYSAVPGSGNSPSYLVTLPKEPPTRPKQDGSGGTANFQLSVAAWFGMAMCDSQSAPEFTHTPCTPDSDTNIFDNSDPMALDYLGHHPGTAYMEFQFYPPGWVASCSATQWSAAMNIFTFSFDQNHGVSNNADCLTKVGPEPVNIAPLTRSGTPMAPPDPLKRAANYCLTNVFFNSGDTLALDMHDTPDGFTVVVKDLTTGDQGSMTASSANGFAQVVFDPTAPTCTSVPYTFHPMYSTSSEHTRVPWAGHTYNIGFVEEIGHFEYCSAVDKEGGSCTAPGGSDSSPDTDNNACYSPGYSFSHGVGGCLAETPDDTDFDGVAYQATWPGTLNNPTEDSALHPTSIRFTSPVFQGSGTNGGPQNYDRVAFEANLPPIETSNCNVFTGAGCVNPPPGVQFYPLFTTRSDGDQCLWQFGGTQIPGTTNTFGGTSTAEFGPLLLTDLGPYYGQQFTVFRHILDSNPCPATSAGCSTTPESGCRTPTAPGASVVQLKTNANSNKRAVSWKWSKGAATTLTDFGDPTTSTSYAVCVYDEAASTPSLVSSAAAPAGTSWKATAKGFTYVNKTLTPDGIQQIVLQQGAAGDAKITVSGKGANLSVPTLPLMQDPKVLVQLQSSAGVCWEADYSAPATTNSSAKFKDSSD